MVRAFLLGREHKVSLTLSGEETLLWWQQHAPEAGKVWEREKARKWRWLLSGVAMVSAGWGGRRGQRSTFVCPFCSVSFMGSRLGRCTLTHNIYHLIALLVPTTEHVWVIKVKSGHECISCYRPTFQVHHPPVTRSMNTAGEQYKKKAHRCPVTLSLPSNTLSYSPCGLCKVG